jgi:hypothetical protein
MLPNKKQASSEMLPIKQPFSQEGNCGLNQFQKPSPAHARDISRVAVRTCENPLRTRAVLLVIYITAGFGYRREAGEK